MFIGDGRLTSKVLRDRFEKIMGKCISNHEFQEIVANIDQDNDGFIEYHEFLRVCVNQKQILKEENLKQAFYNFDDNNDGKLSVLELKKILGTADMDVVQEIVKNIDKNHDGFVSYQEFSDLMKQLIQDNTPICDQNCEKNDETVGK